MEIGANLKEVIEVVIAAAALAFYFGRLFRS